MHEGKALDEAMAGVDKLAAQMASGNATLRDELISAGYAAVARCWKRYDPSRGVKFSTFAHRAIRGAMKAALRREINQPAQMIETQEAGSAMYMGEFAASGNPPLECRISFRVTMEVFDRLATIADRASDAGQALSVNEAARALVMLALRED
jgi:hypothetical protein